MKISLIFFTLFFCMACKNNSPVNSVNDPLKENPSEDSLAAAPILKKDSGSYRLVIMFYSIGSGIETPLMKAFEDSIAVYSERVKKNIDYKKTPWGREGETDFCLMLNELTPAEQVDFVSSTREQLKNAKWVNILENSPCRNRRR